MKRWTFTILLFLLLGAIVNVAVAWGCALWVDAVPLGSMERSQSGASHLEQPRWDVMVVEGPAATSVFATASRISRPRPLPPGASEQEIERHREDNRRYEAGEPSTSWAEPASRVVAVPSWSRVARRPTAEEIDRVRYTEEARGWPLRCLLSRHDAKRADPYAAWGGFVPGWAIDLQKDQGTLGVPRVLPLRPIALRFIINTLLYAVVMLLVFIACVYLRRVIRIKRGRCPKCGYDLRGDLERGCPECGWGREVAASE